MEIVYNFFSLFLGAILAYLDPGHDPYCKSGSKTGFCVRITVPNTVGKKLQDRARNSRQATGKLTARTNHPLRESEERERMQ
jgi:hypothetical protein